ncbi:MAG: ERCC4 domain-containing protein, partial [Bacteroidales bacterium]
NDEVLFERKSRDDFVLSIIQGRLFSQCARMKRSDYHSVLLIEGNPYNTRHEITRQSIKGALLSVSVPWQIPVIFSSSPHDSADMLLTAGDQLVRSNYNYIRKGYKPKSVKRKSLYFLQGLPAVGPSTAKALLERFGTPEKVILATEDELMEIEGLGATKARRIREFLSK